MNIPAYLLDLVFAHCREQHPKEACGLLAGPRDGAGPIERWQMRNVAEHPRHRYAMDPEGQMITWKAIEAIGHRVFAIYHSHTAVDDRGEPSPEDLRYALDSDVLHLIVVPYGTNPQGDRWYGAQARLWKVVDGQGIEQPYTIVEKI